MVAIERPPPTHEADCDHRVTRVIHQGSIIVAISAYESEKIPH